MSANDAPAFSKDGAHPEIGSLVYDERRRLVGTVKSVGYHVILRPEGGGREWDAEWDNLRPATEADRLGSRVRSVNRANDALRAVAHPEIRTLGSSGDPGV